ncbi:MAG: hypothetical protein OEV59_09355 [Deltaproteobacteria bacterium]|nr:hypothetical protein [Deltaproteobacteria bacterium]
MSIIKKRNKYALILAAAVVIIAAFGAVSSFAAGPAKKYAVNYVGSLNASPSGAAFSSVKDIFISTEPDEIYALDSGNRRVVVFDFEGIPVFWFKLVGADERASFNSIVVSKDGYVYVSTDKMLLMYSYRGTFIKAFDTAPLGETATVLSLSIGSNGILYVGYRIEEKGSPATGVIAVYAPDGTFKEIIKISGATYANIFDLTRLGDKYYFIERAKVQVVTLDSAGRQISSFGKYSSLLGGFSQPVSLDVTPDVIYVADSNRKMVILFDHVGNPITEFGGPQVFVTPYKVATAPSGRIYVCDRGEVRVFEVKSDTGASPAKK